jgi:hypothetical protein
MSELETTTQRLEAEQERERAVGRGPLLGRLMLLRQRAGAIA